MKRKKFEGRLNDPQASTTNRLNVVMRTAEKIVPRTTLLPDDNFTPAQVEVTTLNESEEPAKPRSLHPTRRSTTFQRLNTFSSVPESTSPRGDRKSSSDLSKAPDPPDGPSEYD